MASKDEVLKVLKLLQLNFPEWQKGKGDKQMAQIFTLYCNRLAPIPADVLQEVALEVIDTATFFPKIAELKQPALARMRQNKALTHDQKLLAYRTEAVPHAEGIRRLKAIVLLLAGKFSFPSQEAA